MAAEIRTETKYVVHRVSYHGLKHGQQTFKRLDSAKERLDLWRRVFRAQFHENGMCFSGGSEPITKEKLEDMVRRYFYTEEVTTTKRALDV